MLLGVVVVGLPAVGASAGGGAAAGAGGGVRGGAGVLWRPARVCTCWARWWTPRPASVCCATGRSGWRWRCRDTRWPGAGAVVTLRRWLRPAGAALVCCLALILALPDLAWGVWGRVAPVHYPAGWAAVAAAINADAGPVAVLPAGTMRRFSWSGPAPVLDPLPRWVRADVLTTGDLAISGVTVPGEGAHARAVQGCC